VGGAADSTVLENWMEGKWVGPLMGHSWKKWVELLMGYSWKIGRKIKVQKHSRIQIAGAERSQVLLCHRLHDCHVTSWLDLHD